MHNRFDRFVKRLARKAIAPCGDFETDAEVSPDAHRIDIWFTPDPPRARAVLAPLGLFGRICQRACTLEHFHRTPSGDLVADCVARHRFFCRELARRKPRPPAPMQWVLSAGRPSEALAGLAFRRSPLGKGVYVAPPLLRTHLLVLSELPRTRSTLMLRLMGASRTLRDAISDAQALPPEAPERRLALPILIRLRLDVPTDPAKQTPNDREFLMSTQNIDKYLEQIEQKGHQEGLRKGLREGLREGVDRGLARGVLLAYRVRFGAPPATVTAAVKGTRDPASLERWLELVMTRPLEEVTSALRAPPASTSPRRKGSTARVQENGNGSPRTAAGATRAKTPARSRAKAPPRSRTTSGNRSRTTSGNRSRTTAGNRSRTTAGNRSRTTAGNRSRAEAAARPRSKSRH